MRLIKIIWVTQIFSTSCGISNGTQSFSFNNIFTNFHPQKIVDGFNQSITKNIGGDDHTIKNINKIYNSSDEAIKNLYLKNSQSKKLWHPYLKKELDEFLLDAKKHDVIISQHSLERFIGAQVVDQISDPSKKNVSALCIRVNFKTNDLNQRKIYRIELLKKKYNNLIQKATHEKSLKEHQQSSKTPSETILKRILYHEFMHCLLHVGHLPNKTQFKNHIMYPKYSKHENISIESWNQMLEKNFDPNFIKLMPYIE